MSQRSKRSKPVFVSCLLCRFALAFDTASEDAIVSLTHQATRLFKESCGSGQSLEEFASCLECSCRHLIGCLQRNITPLRYSICKHADRCTCELA